MKIKKLLYAVLTLNTFLGSFCVNAMPLGDTTSEPSKVQQEITHLSKKVEMQILANKILLETLETSASAEDYLATQIRLFESHHPNMFNLTPKLPAMLEERSNGIFLVSPAAVENLDHFLLAKNLECIIGILKKYPVIAMHFFQILQSTSGTFEIGITDEETVAKFCYGYGVMQSISFNPNFYRSIEEIPALGVHSYVVLMNIKSGFFSPVDEENLPNKAVLHEMGHWFELNLPYFPMINIVEESEKLGLEPPIDTSQENMKSRAIKIEILKIAMEKYGYRGNGFISKYGEYNDDDWFAEVFSHALGSLEPNALGKAMLDWLALQNG